MKKTGKSSGKWEDEEESQELDPKDHKGKKWYEYIPYDKIRDKVPLLRNIRGGKKELRFWTFHETWEEGQELFDKNKTFFRTRNQVDLSAHYLGMRLLYELHKNGMPQSDLSSFLEEQEAEFTLFDRMKHVKETFKNLIEHHLEGFVTEEELDKKAERHINSFKKKSDQIKVARMLDLLFESGEMKRAGDRIRQRKHREYEKKTKDKQ